MYFYDEHFRVFATSLENLMVVHGENTTERQKEQVETLISLENEFKSCLIKDWRGPLVYKAFLKYIMDERKNILAARPYFRERQDVFKREISPVLRNREDIGLYKFNINFTFIKFVLRAKHFSLNSRVRKLARAVEKVRTELIEMNIPLAISRAKIFKQHTPQSHLEYLDLIQIANEGLIAAVDKFVLPYTPVFRAVIIGRISGNHIESYSETLLHFYPSDKRKLYRANKIQSRKTETTFEEIAAGVNKDLNKDCSASEIQQLLSAASHVSIDAPIPDNGISDSDSDNSIEKHAAPESTRPDVIFEDLEARFVLRNALDELTVLEKKFIRMKGISI